jgi:hypothetical protein
MQTSEIFLTFVRRLIFSFFLILMIAAATQAHGQTSGTVGLYTRQITVFTAQATSTHSAIFPDFGYAANYLTYCTSGFGGTIDLEWSPNPLTTAYITLAQASYGLIGNDTNCHTLQAGGYYPNMRSTVTRTAGSVSAWYTASAGPVSYVAAGIGSNGPSSPITCDQSTTFFGILSGGTGGGPAIEPLQTGDTVVICGFQWSFNGATSAGFLEIEWAPAGTCTGATVNWQAYTTANTPQIFTVPLQQRSTVLANQSPCFVNGSGATASVSVSWASVHGL